MNLNQTEVKEGMENKKPTPEELLKIKTLKLLTEAFGNDVYIVAKRLTQSIECKVTRSRKKKQYVELYEKYIKGTKNDIETENK